METTPNYKRSATIPLLVLRMTLIVTSVALIYFILNYSLDYAVFFSLLIIPLFFISFTEVNIFEKRISITKYFIFGFKTQKYNINSSSALSMTLHRHVIETMDVENSLVDIKGKTTRFIYLDENGNEKDASVGLKSNEYKMIWNVLNGNKLNSC